MKFTTAIVASCLLLSGCYQEPNPNIATLLITTEGTAEADNFSTVKLTFQIQGTKDMDARSIVVTTNLGVFPGSSTPTSVTLITKNDGSASTSIKSDTKGVANIVASIGNNVVTYRDITFSQKTSIISITPGVSTIEADGKQEIRIDAAITKANNVNSQAITLITTLGTFSNGTATTTITTGADGKGYAFMKSNVAGNAVLQASLGTEATQQSLITFAEAKPDFIQVSTDLLEGTSGPANLLEVTCTLTRTSGNPSTGYLPMFEAFDINGASIGLFTVASASDAAGKSKIKFAIQDKTFTGKVTFKCTLQFNGRNPLVATSGPVVYKAGS